MTKSNSTLGIDKLTLTRITRHPFYEGWELMFESLLAYQEIHGNNKFPSMYIMDDGIIWAANNANIK